MKFNKKWLAAAIVLAVIALPIIIGKSKGDKGIEVDISQAGLHEIPAVIRDDLSDTEAFVVGLIENLQRESLSPVETASGLKRLAEVLAKRGSR